MGYDFYAVHDLYGTYCEKRVSIDRPRSTLVRVLEQLETAVHAVAVDDEK